MAVTIRPATVDDAPSMAQVHYNALELYHDFYGAFFVTHPRDLLPEATASALQNPKNVFLVAVEKGSGVTVGFVRYNVVEATPARDNEKEKESDKKAESGPTIFAVKEHLKELWERFNERGRRWISVMGRL
ncbi:hypothetical protein PT974_04397 [Cladobotryum mycophilum]|uniref:N-acetyltransferase domain-containing protein n=1 Tax=Cladobotryum mycophilum TaxID=491253 RepID=A0ABR0SV29_9HYPO